MKKLIYSFAVAAVALGFSGCKETWDENPVYTGHEGVIKADFLNNPAMQEMPIMITNENKIGTFLLTCSQPDYGYAAVATYKVQVSLTEDFAEMQEISQDFFDCAAIKPVNGDVAAAIEKLSGVKTEEDLPLPYQTVYMRLRSFIAQTPDNSQYISNVVKFDQVSADYLAIWVADVPVNFYLRGGMNDWGTPEDWQFVTGKEENTWVLNNVTIAAGTNFKVGDPSWGDMNYGATEKLVIGEELPLVYNAGDINLPSDFTGNIQLRLDKGTYYLLLDPTPAK